MAAPRCPRPGGAIQRMPSTAFPEDPPMTSPLPLDGVRIFDLTRILAGPTCTQLLGDIGADVITTARPGEGDNTRNSGPQYATGADGETAPNRQEVGRDKRVSV